MPRVALSTRSHSHTSNSSSNSSSQENNMDSSAAVNRKKLQLAQGLSKLAVLNENQQGQAGKRKAADDGTNKGKKRAALGEITNVRPFLLQMTFV